MKFSDGNASVELTREGDEFVVTLSSDGKQVNQTRHETRSQAVVSFGKFTIGELATWHSDPEAFERAFNLF